MVVFLFFLFKQMSAYELRISDWSSDVCSSDLVQALPRGAVTDAPLGEGLSGRLNARAQAATPTFRRWEESRPTISPRRRRWAGRAGTGSATRSEERSVGKGGVSTCRPRWSPQRKKTKSSKE